MIYYIVAAVLVVIIVFLIILFYFKKSKNKKHQLITKTNNISLQDNQPSVIKTQPEYDGLEDFYKDFDINKCQVLGLSNTNSTINIAYQDTAIKSAVEVARTIIQKKTLQSVFVATVAPSELMKLSDGGFSSAVIDFKGVIKKGRIIRHTGFKALNPTEIAKSIGPQVVFSVLSIAVGQHFMADISQKLSDISEKLDKILHHFTKEYIAILESSKELIHNISKQKYADKEHIDRLMRIEENLNNIYKYYEYELKNININNLDTNEWEFYGKIEEMDKKLEKEIEYAQFYVQICFYSKELLNLIQLVKFNTYIKMQKVDANAINKANELFEEINNWKSDLFYNEDNPYNKYIDIIEESKEKLKKIHDNAPIIKFLEDTILLRENKYYSSKKIKFEDKKNIGLNNYNSMSYEQSRIMIEKIKKPKDIILLKDYSGNIVSLCKKE